MSDVFENSRTDVKNHEPDKTSSYLAFFEFEWRIYGFSDMLPPLKSQILKWGLLAQWLY